MNTLMMQMRHTAHELRVTLDHVLQGGEASVEPQNSQSETVSFLNESEAEMRAIHNMAEVRTKAASESCFISPALFELENRHNKTRGAWSHSVLPGDARTP